MKKAILLLIILSSCKTHYTTNYKVVTKERAYYTNNITCINDSIMLYENGRNGYPRRMFLIPVLETKIIKNR